MVYQSAVHLAGWLPHRQSSLACRPADGKLSAIPFTRKSRQYFMQVYGVVITAGSQTILLPAVACARCLLAIGAAFVRRKARGRSAHAHIMWAKVSTIVQRFSAPFNSSLFACYICFAGNHLFIATSHCPRAAFLCAAAAGTARPAGRLAVQPHIAKSEGPRVSVTGTWSQRTDEDWPLSLLGQILG